MRPLFFFGVVPGEIGSGRDSRCRFHRFNSHPPLPVLMATSFRHPSLPPGLRCLARPPRGPGAGALPVLVSPRTRQRWPARTRCPPPISRNPNAGGRGRGARRNQRAPQRRAKPATVPRCTLALCAPGRAGPTSRRVRGSVPKVTFEEKTSKAKQGQTRPNKTKQDQNKTRQRAIAMFRRSQNKAKQDQTRPKQDFANATRRANRTGSHGGE